MDENKIVVTDPRQIAGSIIVAGVIIAGAILLHGNITPPGAAGVGGTNPPAGQVTGNPQAVSGADRVIGSPSAKLTVIMYEDFQCPFCGKFHKDSEGPIRDTYVKNGQVRLVYRDFAFLGEESFRSAEAARCAGDQGKFWEYHDYLFEHQSGENQGAFADEK